MVRRRRIALELAVVAVLMTLAGGIWLAPASARLLAGDATVMIGDGSDSTVLPMHYQVIVDTAKTDPLHLLRGALFTDQVQYPDGTALFIPYVERAIVLALAPFLRVDLTPTAVIWVLVVLSGLAMHVCARSFGWPRLLSFAVGFAWAICPFTRARAECHNVMVGVFFAPAVVTALRVLAGAPPALRWSKRRELVVAALLLFFAACSAHYYVLLLVSFAPFFLGLYLALLPRGTPRPRALVRLALASIPAAVVLVSTAVFPLPRAEAESAARASAPEDVTRKFNERVFRSYPAHIEDYVAGDVKLGDRDVMPWRAAITRRIERQVKANRHERTNGIRWAVIALGLAAFAGLAVPRLRARARPTREDVAVLVFAAALGVTALWVSLGPSFYLARVFARLVPPFRVVNRVGLFVHFSMLLAAGVALRRVASRRWVLPAFFALVVVEYLPLHPVLLTPVAIRRDDLAPPGAPEACGPGITAPYVTYDFEPRAYYRALAEIRGTSCKLLHAGYLAPEDEALRKALGARKWDEPAIARTVDFARCTGASWIVFEAEPPAEVRRQICTRLGWSFVGEDSCRSGRPSDRVTRAVRECIP